MTKYDDITSWRLPEPEDFAIIAGLLRGALVDFAKFVADKEPQVSEKEILKYLDTWGDKLKIPIADGDVRFWEDVKGTPREYPPFTQRSDRIPIDPQGGRKK